MSQVRPSNRASSEPDDPINRSNNKVNNSANSYHAESTDGNTDKLPSYLVISIAAQTLSHYRLGKLIKRYSVSTAKNGVGSVEGSGQTPLGRHTIAAKIGAKAPINSVFIGRIATGEIYDQKLGEKYPDRDWILSRILWLDGCEEGRNKGSNECGVCDTYQRYIYIHGTPDTEPMGVPLSHGCIRMRNEDIAVLFDQVEEGTVVDIVN
ncbi:L,D-transpeptidase [Psychrobacter pygoscelis]|uniref:L,D-transpeptidase n=1 Tax=Psychrobacter pygoscelis TaxID=2488563 RepID=UPI00103A60C5|nr:L,D-transpeptidase [Psychrobacter pygoscelis]